MVVMALLRIVLGKHVEVELITHNSSHFFVFSATAVSDAVAVPASVSSDDTDTFSDNTSSTDRSTNASSPPPRDPPHGSKNNKDDNSQIQGGEGMDDDASDSTVEGEEELERRLRRIEDRAQGKPLRFACRAKKPGSRAQRISLKMGCMRV